MLRFTIAIAGLDLERIRKAAQRRGIPYTVWCRERLVRLADEELRQLRQTRVMSP